MLIQEGWIYYIRGGITDDYGCIYKIRTDGTSHQKLNNDGCKNINIADDWIYYSNYSDYNGVGNPLYRIRTNGSDRQKICDYVGDIYNIFDGWIYYAIADASFCKCLYRVRTNGFDIQRVTKPKDNFGFLNTIIGDWIYYTTNISDILTVYKIKTGGSWWRKKLVNFGAGGGICFVGDWIYYGDKRNNYDINNVCKIRLDGKMNQKLFDFRYYGGGFAVANGWIYYRNDGDNKSIYRHRTDGTKQQKLTNGRNNIVYIKDDWLYFKHYDNDNSLYRVKTDGTGHQKFFHDFFKDTGCGFVKILGEWVYYSDIWDDRKLYKMKLDGTKRQKLCNDHIMVFETIVVPDSGVEYEKNIFSLSHSFPFI